MKILINNSNRINSSKLAIDHLYKMQKSGFSLVKVQKMSKENGKNRSIIHKLHIVYWNNIINTQAVKLNKSKMFYKYLLPSIIFNLSSSVVLSSLSITSSVKQNVNTFYFNLTHYNKEYIYYFGRMRHL